MFATVKQRSGIQFCSKLSSPVAGTETEQRERVIWSKGLLCSVGLSLGGSSGSDDDSMRFDAIRRSDSERIARSVVVAKSFLFLSDGISQCD